MVPPSDTCKQLFQLHPQLRVGWCGRPPVVEGDLNSGAFTVCQLFYINDIGDLDDPLTVSELWEVGWGVDRENNSMVRKRVDRGPLFSRKGENKRDYDPLFRIPVWMMTLDGSWNAYDGVPLVNEDISNGRLVHTVKKLLGTRLSTRIQRSRDEAAADLNRRVNDTTDEMTDFLWREANKSSSNTVTMAKKHIKEDVGYERWQRLQQLDLGQSVYGQRR